MDIFWICKQFIERLIKRNRLDYVLARFNEIKEIDKKVHFIKVLLIDMKYMKIIEGNYVLRNAKSNELSVKFRKAGHQQILSKNYFKALELYNVSICHSEAGSENESLGYTYRSMVMFELKYYRECLANIELARKANCPVRFKHTFDKGEESCRQLLDTQVKDIQPFEFAMFEEHHRSVLNVADCLEMRSSEVAQRFICATRDLKVGDVIASEEPFCATLMPLMRYIRCATCKKENHLTLIPCTLCTCAMFCSDKCRNIANETFHKYECPIIDLLHKMFNCFHGMALRVCLSALELFPTIGQLMAFCADSRNQNCSAFDYDFCHFTRREHYRAIHGLVTNQKSRNVTDLLQRTVICAVLEHYLIKHTPLQKFLGGAEGKSFFRKLLFQHLQTASCNMQAIDLVEQVNESETDRAHSAGVFAFLSLLNHSCAPNTMRVYQGTTAFLIVLRPIPANGELFDNYSVHFATQPRNVRRGRLQMQYHFTCNCEACKNDYPCFGKLLPKPNVPYVTKKIDKDSLADFDWRFAFQNYSKYCNFLNKYADTYPCDQISAAEECLKMAQNILVDAVPLKVKIDKKVID